MDDIFTVWRRSYKHLRLLESELVSRSRSGEDPALIARMYEKIEAQRARTSDLFRLAQTASMRHQIPIARLAAMRWDVTPSEFEAVHDG